MQTRTVDLKRNGKDVLSIRTLNGLITAQVLSPYARLLVNLPDTTTFCLERTGLPEECPMCDGEEIEPEVLKGGNNE